MFWPVQVIIGVGKKPDSTIEDINKLADSFLEILFQEAFDNPDIDISKRHFYIEAARQEAILTKYDQDPTLN